MSSQRRGQLAGLGAAVLFGCSAPLISTITGAGSALSIAGLLYLRHGHPHRHDPRGPDPHQ